MAAQSTLDGIHRLLATSERRYLLSLLQETKGGKVEEFACRIAAAKRGVSPTAVDEDTRKQITIALVHNHLPLLADHQVVKYDDETGEITPKDGLHELAPYLEAGEPPAVPLFSEADAK